MACDDLIITGITDVKLGWRYVDKSSNIITRDMHEDRKYTITEFASTFKEMGQSKDPRVPSFVLIDDDINQFEEAIPHDLGPPLLPNVNTTMRTFKKYLDSVNNGFCTADISYTITFQLRQYLFLE